MLIIGAREVQEILAESPRAVLDAVANAYRLHDAGRTAVPHSTFLRFPERPRERIIGLPAYLGAEVPVAGMKWIASFPDNIAQGLPRANAVVVLNSMATGEPLALLEGSLISAARTGASAALAAAALSPVDGARGISLIGCGVINLEVLRYTLALMPEITEITVCDTDEERARAFAGKAAALAPRAAVSVTTDSVRALGAHPLVSVATNTIEPHLDLAPCRPGSIVLHVSLRDLTPEAVLGARNIVDDPDHVCRERTSLHLAELQCGGREFVHGTIGGLLRADGDHHDPDRVTVFSPFGLGVLDLALADAVHTAAAARGLGTDVPDFLPDAAIPAVV
jgi:ornithine cyclodeaminase